MNTAQLVLVFLLTSLHIAALLLGFFWYRRRFGTDAPPKEEAGVDAAALMGFDAPSTTASSMPSGGIDLPYHAVSPLNGDERALMNALSTLHGDGFVLYPRVAADACIQPTRAEEAERSRVRGHCFDFVVVDRATGALVSVFLLRRGGHARPEEQDFLAACAAADMPPTIIDSATPTDASSLRQALGWPENDIG